MNAGSFILMYEKKTNNRNLEDAEIITLVSNILNIQRYINFEDKCSIIKKVIQDSTQYNNGKVSYDSNHLYYVFINQLLDVYTNLDINEETYDLLCRNNLLDVIIAAIGREYEVCLGIMNNYIDDLNAGRINYETNKIQC